MSFRYPDPILDATENDHFSRLVREYEDFKKPGRLSRGISVVSNKVASVTPIVVKNAVSGAKDKIAGSLKAVSEADLIKQALCIAQDGFGILTSAISSLSLSPDGIVKKYNKCGMSIESYEYVCTLRGYKISKILWKNRWWDYGCTLTEGAATGFYGFYGLPFNLALSLLLYFRAAQSSALYWGYDVVNDPAELQIASEVTLFCLNPTVESGVLNSSGLLGKMMLASNATALQQALATKTFGQMIERGGAELLYVQIRALANKAAQKALEKAGERGIEQQIFKQMLEQLGRLAPREAAKKAIPVVGAVVGALFDTAFVHRVLRGSMIFYHKRFLAEKEHRVHLLRDRNAL